MKKLLTVLFISVFFLISPANSQNLLKLSAEVYNAFDELKTANENIKKVQSIVKDIEKGNTPNVSSYGSDWSALANNYKKAAQTIKNAKLVTDFDANQYIISVDEINNCYLKEQNFGKLRDYQFQLENAVNVGQSELNKIAENKKLIEQTRAALQYLIDVNAKLMSVPLYNQIFQWNWVDLELGVRPELSNLSTTINEQEKKMKQEIDKVKTQSANLASNINLLENSLCQITGTYSGIQPNSNPNMQLTYTLTINKNGNGYNGNWSFSSKYLNGTKPISSISFSQNKIISFSIYSPVTEADVNLQGELSSDYKQIVFKSPTVTLIK